VLGRHKRESVGERWNIEATERRRVRENRERVRERQRERERERERDHFSGTKKVGAI